MLSKVDLDGERVTAEPNETILSLARRHGKSIPTLCDHPDLEPAALCRVCLVDIEKGDRTSTKPACVTAVESGMKITTSSPDLDEQVKHNIEMLRCRHPNACMTCAVNGRCELQDLVQQYNVEERAPYKRLRTAHFDDHSSNALSFDMEKCILCERCVRACSELSDMNILGIADRGGDAGVSTAFGVPIAETECISCGQCALHCPVGAITEKDHVHEVEALLRRKEKTGKTLVVQTAPATRIAISEEFSMEPGTVSEGQLVAALRELGFDYVFDTNFTADLTIMEEGTELLKRIKAGGPFPMFTSCCPAWVNLVEKCYPEYLENLSSCKSPQGMLGTLVKEEFPKQLGKTADDVISVSVMPCTAKKDEMARPQLSSEWRQAEKESRELEAARADPDVDFVLTTREFARLMRMRNMPFASMGTSEYDAPLGIASGAGLIFGATGGVMEAALRTVYELQTGKAMGRPEYYPVRGLEGVRESVVRMDGVDVRVAVAHTTGHARKLIEKMKRGETPEYHFVEVMACRGGCLGGGGEPKSLDPDVLKKRVNAIYGMDKTMKLRKSHENPQVQQLYERVLGEPGSERAEEWLHTTYSDRTDTVRTPASRSHDGGYTRNNRWRWRPKWTGEGGEPEEDAHDPILQAVYTDKRDGEDIAVEQVFT